MKDKIHEYLDLFLIGGIFGFLYEELFYYIDLGYLVKRGSTFGPWIPIYGFGSMLIYFICTHVPGKQNVFKTFLLSLISCGILEYLTGYFLLQFGGIRLWDYSNEIWNFGNIGGFICLRSVLFFGLSGVFLMNVVVSFIEKKLSFRKLYSFDVALSYVFILDFLVNLFI